METRTIKELLEFLLDSIRKGNLRTGICGVATYWMVRGVISGIELDIIESYIKKNNPNTTSEYGYFWPVTEEKPRIAWLEEHIKLNTSDES